MRIKLAITAAILMLSTSCWAQTSVRKIEYRGWEDCYELSNPHVRLVVVPQIGGRIMEYSLDGEDVFWQNEGELGKVSGSDIGKKWRNYGGYKAWNAPQSRWQGPDEDWFYDSMPAEVEVLPARAGIRITTAPIPRLRFRFVREVSLSPVTSRVRIVEKMRNVSEQGIEWSVWDVTQVKVPCWMVFPLNENSRFPKRWNVIMTDKARKNQITTLGNIGVLQYKDTTENWATDAKGGWMAYLRGQLAYTKHWSTRLVGATYPDGECDAAFFTADKGIAGGYAEMEVMGPIAKLAPGQETELVEDWFLTRVNQSAKDIPELMERMKLVQKRGMLPRSIKFD